MTQTAMPMPAVNVHGKKVIEGNIHLQRRRSSIELVNESNGIKSTVFLALLAIQIGIQPELMKWYAKDATNVPLRITVIGLLKILVALIPLCWNGQWRMQFTNWSYRIALRTTVLPALIYSVQDYLNQTAIVILDGVTYNVLNQTKIIWTALLVYLMLGKKQSTIQVFALVLLVVSAVLIAVGGTTEERKLHLDKNNENEVLRFTGMTRAAFAAVLSAFAGTIIQKALQRESRNAYMVTIELSTINIFCCFWSYYAGQAMSTTKDNDTQHNESIWTGWTFMTFVTLFIQALGGVLVGFVIKYSGNIKKSFAVVGGLLLTAVLESIVNRTDFGVSGYASTTLVTLSTVLYTNNPPQTEPSPVAKLKSEMESPSSVPPQEDDTTEDSDEEEDSTSRRLLFVA